jgi:hypothetical protein
MKLDTQVRHYDGTIVTKIQINIFDKKRVIEILAGAGVPPRVAEGLVLLLA